MSAQTLFTVIVFNSLVLFIPVAMLLLYMRPQLWHYLFALFLGLVIGWMDMHSVEVQPTVLLLLVCSWDSRSPGTPGVGRSSSLYGYRWAGSLPSLRG